MVLLFGGVFKRGEMYFNIPVTAYILGTLLLRSFCVFFAGGSRLKMCVFRAGKTVRYCFWDGAGVRILYVGSGRGPPVVAGKGPSWSRWMGRVQSSSFGLLEVAGGFLWAKGSRVKLSRTQLGVWMHTRTGTEEFSFFYM